MATFKAIRIDKAEKGTTVALVQFDEADLMEGDVTVRVEWSTLNYKDGLAVTGKAPVVRRFPMIAGIDFAGTVEQSSHPRWKAGDRVICNGWGLGETHLGSYAEKARVKGDWLVRLPENISARDAMAIGTAGYTAMLSVLALEKHGLTPAAGEILVTGAAGGVGSVAVAILAKLGFTVVAATGRPQEADYLRALGATTIMDRKELTEAADRPLLSERFAGLVDTVSGVMFARALAQVKYGGAAAVCGLAAGPAFPGSILPFILRSITVYGIDSVMLPRAPREEAWRRLGSDLPLDKLDSTVSEVGLSDLMPLATRILKGEVRGRVVVNVAE